MKIKVIEKEQDDKEKELRDTVDITDTIERMGDNTSYRFNCVEIERKNGGMVITLKLNDKVMHVMSPLHFHSVDFNKGDIISINGFNATSDVIMSWDN